MALKPNHDNIHYLVGRLCAEIYPESVGAIPAQLTSKALVNPIEAIGLLKLPNTDAIAEIMASMPTPPPDYPEGARSELQGEFWVGYYHQRAAKRQANALTANDLTQAGQALFGERWQTEMANALGLNDSARIRQMLSGRRPVPPGIAAEILALLRQKSVEANDIANEIERR